MSTLDPDQLARTTLQRQLLLRRGPATVTDAVRRVGALQAQEPPAPSVALWSRIISDRYRSHAIRRNGDVLPTVLVNGRVAGVWNSGPDGIEVGAFEPFDLDTWDALDGEARDRHAALADRDPSVFERAGTWWSRLPIDSTRRLGS